MMKLTCYLGSLLSSYEIDSVPHADMSQILTLAVPGSWGDYSQVLNSDSDLEFDLDLKCIDGTWLIPITAVTAWLFTFKLSTRMKAEAYEIFRIFRRDLEKVLRVAWALPVDDLVLRNFEAPYRGESNLTMWDISNVFLTYGLLDEELEGSEVDDMTPIEYIEYIAAATSCGARGHLLCDQIQYIEDLPNGSDIFSHINEILTFNVIPPTDYLDDYLDLINSFISLEASRFVGEI